MLRGHMDQTCANNQSNQPPTYAADDAAYLTLATLPETTLNPEASAD